MSNTSDTSIEALISVLRADTVPVAQAARERIGSCIDSAVMGLSAGDVSARGLGQAKTGVVDHVASLLRSKLVVVALTLPVGVAVGAAGHAWITTSRTTLSAAAPKPASVGAARPVLAASGAQPPLTALAPPAEVPVATPQVARSARSALPVTPSPSTAETRVAPVTGGARTPGVSAAASEDGAGTETELSLLEEARSKLSAGDANATLRLLRQHRARYPSSSFEQERGALSVRAFAAAGRRDEARAAVSAFVRQFPDSPLRGSVERVAAAIP